jgi:hypothetical protein
MVNKTFGKIVLLLIGFVAGILYGNAQNTKTPAVKSGTVQFTFTNWVKAAPLILDSMEYVNLFDEPYNITKLKYYISNITVNNLKQSFAEPGSYHLLDESNPASLSFNFDAAANTYNSISFTIGVDSIKNVSGAQTGTLDPANGMFWTWNSGYIFFKLEGRSALSPIINNKIEYHIGGYAAPNNALKRVTLQLPAGKMLQVQAGKTSEIFIAADIDKLWQSPHDLRIAVTAVTMTPGTAAIKIADNYSKIFSVKDVLNN